MSSSAGLADIAKRSRIKKRAVRPPVAGRPVATAEIKEEVPVITPEPVQEAPVMPQVAPAPVEVVAKQEVSLPVEPAKPEKKGKKSAVKKVGHTQPRFEVRFSGDHEKLVEDIQKKAFRESLAANKGINNSELFGGFLESIRPYLKSLSFSCLNFKRGKLYGDGTERIKVEIGKSLQRSSFEYFLAAIEAGDNDVVKDVLDSLSPERRAKVARLINSSSSQPEQFENEQIAANS